MAERDLLNLIKNSEEEAQKIIELAQEEVKKLNEASVNKFALEHILDNAKDEHLKGNKLPLEELLKKLKINVKPVESK